MRLALHKFEIELLEILNGERDGDIEMWHVMCTEALLAKQLLEQKSDEFGNVFVRVSPLGESWLAYYNGRLH